MAIELSELSRLRPFAFHVTVPSNLHAIVTIGELRSAKMLLTGTRHCGSLSRARTSSLVVEADGLPIEVRDQRPLRRGHIRYEGGFEFADVLDDLNSRVFFWPGSENQPIDYGMSHYNRYANVGEAILLRCALGELLDANKNQEMGVSRFNSGAPRRNPRSGRSPRGPKTFVAVGSALFAAGAVKELSFQERAILPRSTEVATSLEGVWRRVWPESVLKFE